MQLYGAFGLRAPHICFYGPLALERSSFGIEISGVDGQPSTLCLEPPALNGHCCKLGVRGTTSPVDFLGGGEAERQLLAESMHQISRAAGSHLRLIF